MSYAAQLSNSNFFGIDLKLKIFPNTQTCIKLRNCKFCNRHTKTKLEDENKKTHFYIGLASLYDEK